MERYNWFKLIKFQKHLEFYMFTFLWESWYLFPIWIWDSKENPERFQLKYCFPIWIWDWKEQPERFQLKRILKEPACGDDSPRISNANITSCAWMSPTIKNEMDSFPEARKSICRHITTTTGDSLAPKKKINLLRKEFICLNFFKNLIERQKRSHGKKNPIQRHYFPMILEFCMCTFLQAKEC